MHKHIAPPPPPSAADLEGGECLDPLALSAEERRDLAAAAAPWVCLEALPLAGDDCDFANGRPVQGPQFSPDHDGCICYGDPRDLETGPAYCAACEGEYHNDIEVERMLPSLLAKID